MTNMKVSARDGQERRHGDDDDDADNNVDRDGLMGGEATTRPHTDSTADCDYNDRAAIHSSVNAVP